MKIQRIILIIIFLSVFSSLYATKYYVSSSSGDDATGRDGKSEATAWRTISKVNGRTFLPGDSILFKRGDIWRETLTVPSSGTPGSYITFSSYGNGVKPQILGSTKVITWTNEGGNVWRSTTSVSNPYKDYYPSEIFFVEKNDSVMWGKHVTAIGGLIAEYMWTWSSNYIYIYSSTDPGTKYNAVEVPQRDYSIHLNSKEYIEINGIDMFYDMFAGVVEQYPTAGLYGYILRNCEIAYNGTLTGEGHGTHVLYNESLIERNVFHDCGRRSVSINHYGNSLIKNVVIQNNVFRNGNHTVGVDLSIGGAGNSGSIDSVIIRNNYFYEDPNESVKYGHGVYLQKYPHGGNTLKGVYIYNNIFRNPTGSSILVERVDQLYIYNNTFCGMNQIRTSNIFFICFTQSSLNSVVKNNIFYGNTNSNVVRDAVCLYVESTSDYKEVTADNNLYYQLDPNARIVEVEDLYTFHNNDIEQIRSDLGWEIHSPTPADPMFVSLTDYHLKAGSPAIGAGIAIKGITTDFEGKPYTNPPSIGAYEANPLKTNVKASRKVTK